MLIAANNIGHSYASPLFENISVSLDAGSVLALYGPSGVGKTTLLEIFWRLLTPKTGSITFHTSLTDRQKSFWYAFVGWPFFEEMTVRENILFLENFSDISINSEKYHEMLEFFEMKTFENSVMKSLSVGQRERVNLIRACVHSPQIVILDEPGSNLDERLFDRVFSFLEKERQSQKNAIILATHHPKFRELATTTLTLEPLHNA